MIILDIDITEPVVNFDFVNKSDIFGMFCFKLY